MPVASSLHVKTSIARKLIIFLERRSANVHARVIASRFDLSGPTANYAGGSKKNGAKRGFLEGSGSHNRDLIFRCCSGAGNGLGTNHAVRSDE